MNRYYYRTPFSSQKNLGQWGLDIGLGIGLDAATQATQEQAMIIDWEAQNAADAAIPKEASKAGAAPAGSELPILLIGGAIVLFLMLKK